MSNLAEKRQEFVDKLNTLKTKRAEEIEISVREYRASLEAKPNKEIEELEKVIGAMDVLVAYENATVLATVKEKHTEDEIHHQNVLSRPGMMGVFANR